MADRAGGSSSALSSVYSQQAKSHEITGTRDDPLQSAGKVLRSERLQIYVLVMVLIERNTGYRRKKLHNNRYMKTGRCG